MVTVKKETINTRRFEHEVIKVINDIKRMESLDKSTVLRLLRTMQSNCYEWSEPVSRDYELPKAMREGKK